MVDHLSVRPGPEAGRGVAVDAAQRSVGRLIEEEGLPPQGARGPHGSVGNRAVEKLARVRRIDERQHEVVERGHLAVGELGRASHQAHERRVERVEIRAVAAPVEQEGVGQPAQALRHHRALHGMHLLEQRVRHAGRHGRHVAGRIAQVIQDSVHAEHRHPINPGIAATALVAMIERFCYFWIVYGGPFPREQTVDTLTAIWYQAIFGVDPAGGDRDEMLQCEPIDRGRGDEVLLRRHEAGRQRQGQRRDAGDEREVVVGEGGRVLHEEPVAGAPDAIPAPRKPPAGRSITVRFRWLSGRVER